MSRLLIFAVVFLFSGCSNTHSPQKNVNLTEADQKLISIIKNDIHIDPVVKTYPNTRWIYLPVTFDFFKIQAAEEPASSSKEAKISTGLRFLEVDFSERKFNISYDVGDNLTYPRTYGYTNTYSEAFQTAQRTMMTAIPRAYGDLAKIPDFFVIIFANVATGIETRLIVHSKDLLRANSDMSFGEEFVKRLIQKPTTGSKAIIDDFFGNHLDDHEMKWPEFLAELIKYRIEFKYTHSDFPPSAETVKEMLQQAIQALQGYSFDDYDGIKLNDLSSEKQKEFSRPEVWSYVDGASPLSVPAGP